MCETVASILCDTSLLQTTDYRLKGKTFGYKMCSRCDFGIQEDARHVLMQCPFYSEERKNLFDSLELVSDIWKNEISHNGHDILHILLGKQPENISCCDMLPIWITAGEYVMDIYKSDQTLRITPARMKRVLNSNSTISYCFVI